MILLESKIESVEKEMELEEILIVFWVLKIELLEIKMPLKVKIIELKEI
jgi:hypothetical protein